MGHRDATRGGAAMSEEEEALARIANDPQVQQQNTLAYVLIFCSVAALTITTFVSIVVVTGAGQ